MRKTIKLHFVERFSEGDTDAQIKAMRKYFTFSPLKECDIIYCASIVQMNQAMVAKANSGKPLIVYCWDYYKWAHDGVQNYDWKRYADFMRQADAIIVPSKGQQRRLKELLDLDSHVVLSGFPTYDIPITDGGFILDPLRYYPEENRDWAERAANELNIPIIHSEHRYDREEFEKLVASCTFLTSCVREASTGGLSLMEGLYLGKPSLISDSPYMGATDYLGEYGTTFQYDNFEDLKNKMKEMFDKRETLSTDKTRKHIDEKMTYDTMAKGIRNICKRFT